VTKSSSRNTLHCWTAGSGRATCCQLQVLSDSQVEQVRAVRTHQDLIRTRTQWSIPAILGVRWCLSDSYLRGAIEGGVFLSEVGWLTNHSYKLSSPKSPEVRSTIKNIFITHTHVIFCEPNYFNLEGSPSGLCLLESHWNWGLRSNSIRLQGGDSVYDSEVGVVQ
jgi:hypothetical protein